MSKRWIASLTVLALASPTSAAPEFAPALPGYHFAFPRDHASHPAYKTEWWYYTGHLAAPGGKHFGYELTFFRVGVTRKPQGPSRWRFQDVYMAHFAVSDENAKQFHYVEKFNRPGLGMAGAETSRYRVWNGTWSAGLEGAQHHLQARAEGWAIDLSLVPLKPPVIHGHEGVSQKDDCPGCASHYYSLTRMRTSGTLTQGTTHLPVSGLTWMDHEFGSSELSKNQSGWDWFSLQLDDGSELMLYRLRERDGRTTPASSGTWIKPDGTWRYLPLKAFNIAAIGQWQSPKTHGTYPMGWRVSVPEEGLDLTVAPSFEDQELALKGNSRPSYWEGSVAVTGRRAGKPLTGQGYVEMTGYAGQFRGQL